jgi:predicted CopG family antitoxin
VRKINSTYKEEKGKINHRVTIALDDQCYYLLKELKKEMNTSQSEIFRKALKFYQEYGEIFEINDSLEERLEIYIEMLADGEHIILDVDHYLSMLKFIDEALKDSENNSFWEYHKKIGKNHAEQFNETERSIDAVMKRLETCNFFRIIKDTPNRFTLLLGSDIPKKFIKLFLTEILNGMGFEAEIKDSFAKLNIHINNISY